MAAASEPAVDGSNVLASRVRREERVQAIRVVEYARFPRIAAQTGLRLGFTRDFSNWGMCLGVDQCEAVGTLLRVSLRDVGGRADDTRIGRVVWNQAERDGRFWLGIELLVAAPHASRRKYAEAPHAQASVRRFEV